VKTAPTLLHSVPFTVVSLKLDEASPVIAQLLEANAIVLYSEISNPGLQLFLNHDIKLPPPPQLSLQIYPAPDLGVQRVWDKSHDKFIPTVTHRQSRVSRSTNTIEKKISNTPLSGPFPRHIFSQMMNILEEISVHCKNLSCTIP
jgi:hypothetical protein